MKLTLEKIIELNNCDFTELLGVGDSHIKLLESVIPAKIIIRGQIIKIKGKKKDVVKIKQILFEMLETLNSRGQLNSADVNNIINLSHAKDDFNSYEGGQLNKFIIFYGNNGAIFPKTLGQKKYLDKVKNNDIVFSIGPAGTGKTFLAVTFAVAALENNEVDRIVLCRPAVEAGENLGFLPGDLKDKVDPYLAPLYDSLNTLYENNKLKNLLESKTIEIAPLAYMRGRTLDRAYIILDEAQNTTTMQMKMFLTRLGISSKAIITGDITQIDLKKNIESGLIHITQKLKNIQGIEFIKLEKEDIIRHPLVIKILEAYDKS